MLDSIESQGPLCGNDFPLQGHLANQSCSEPIRWFQFCRFKEMHFQVISQLHFYQDCWTSNNSGSRVGIHCSVEQCGAVWWGTVHVHCSVWRQGEPRVYPCHPTRPRWECSANLCGGCGRDKWGGVQERAVTGTWYTLLFVYEHLARLSKIFHYILFPQCSTLPAFTHLLSQL